MPLVVPIALNIVVLAIGFVFLHAKLDRKVRPDALLDEIKREVNSIIVELNQTTDRNIGLIEERIETLNAMLEKVDKRLALIRREWEQHEAGARVYTDLKRVAKQSRSSGGGLPPAAGSSEARREPGAEARSEKHPEDASRPSGDSETLPSGSESAKRSQEARSRVREQVVSLHRKGIAPNIIASRVGSTLGEVELIIALHDGKG